VSFWDQFVEGGLKTFCALAVVVIVVAIGYTVVELCSREPGAAIMLGIIFGIPVLGGIIYAVFPRKDK